MNKIAAVVVGLTLSALWGAMLMTAVGSLLSAWERGWDLQWDLQDVGLAIFIGGMTVVVFGLIGGLVVVIWRS